MAKAEKIFKMTPVEFNRPQTFYERIAEYIRETYGMKNNENILAKIQDCLSYDFAVCTEEGSEIKIGLQTNLYRDMVAVGRI